jgi:hypothetical protein
LKKSVTALVVELSWSASFWPLQGSCTRKFCERIALKVNIWSWSWHNLQADVFIL